MKHGQLIPVLQLATGADHHLHVSLLPELLEHVLVEGGLFHAGCAGGFERAFKARRSRLPAHVHVAVGGGRLRARYLRSDLARLRLDGYPLPIPLTDAPLQFSLMQVDSNSIY